MKFKTRPGETVQDCDISRPRTRFFKNILLIITIHPIYNLGSLVQQKAEGFQIYNFSIIFHFVSGGAGRSSMPT